jgi:hypothetical protein
MIFSENRFPLFRIMLQGFEDRAGSQALQPETGHFVTVADQTFGAGTAVIAGPIARSMKCPSSRARAKQSSRAAEGILDCFVAYAPRNAISRSWRGRAQAMRICAPEESFSRLRASPACPRDLSSHG